MVPNARITRPFLRILAVAAAMVAPIAAPAGCAARSEGGAVTRPPTLGEELLALDSARRDGLLTDAEFAQRRDATLRAWKAITVAPVEVDSDDEAREEEPTP